MRGHRPRAPLRMPPQAREEGCVIAWMIAGAALLFMAISYTVHTERVLRRRAQSLLAAVSQVRVHLGCACDALALLLVTLDERGMVAGGEILSAMRAAMAPLGPQCQARDVRGRRRILADLAQRAIALAQSCPSLADDEELLHRLDALAASGRMVRMSCLIHDDRARKFNEALDSLPSGWLGRALGFRERELLLGRGGEWEHLA